MPNYVQNSYGAYPKTGIAGARYASSPAETVQTKVPRNSAYPGRFAFLVPGYGGAGSNMLDTGEIYQVPSPASVAVDNDSIVASGVASAATPQTISGVALNGVIGGTKMYPGRRFSFTFSAHSDWDATTGVLTYKRNGRTVTENIAIPNGGGSVNSVGAGDEFVSFYIPAQTGGGGSLLIGTLALTAAASVLKEILGVVMHTPMHEQNLFDGTGLVYADGEPVDVMDAGEIWVEAEEAMDASDDVYVRVASGAGGSLLGKVRNDSDSSSCVQHTGARVILYDATTGLVALKLK